MGFNALYNKRKREFLLWCNRIRGVSAAPGCRFDPLAWHSGVKDPAVRQLQCRLQMWLRSDPWPRNSICYRVAKKKKRKEKTTANSFSPPTHNQERPWEDTVRRQLCATQGGNPHQPLTLLASPSYTSHFQDCEKINTHCLSHPVCGPLLQQPH